MLADVVIDTNVLVHANNPNEGRQTDSISLIRKLLGCDTLLCVDTGFSANAGRNESKIGSEYLRWLTAGTLGLYFVAEMIASGRIHSAHSYRASPPHRGWLVRNIAKPTDRTFVAVAHDTAERVLVSHDYEDFSEVVRTVILGRMKVRIVEAAECLMSL